MPIADGLPTNQAATTNTGSEEYPITITNGAAQRLKGLMEHFNFNTAKDVVALSLELLESVKDSSSIVVRQKDGSAKRLFIPTTQNDNKKE